MGKETRAWLIDALESGSETLRMHLVGLALGDLLALQTASEAATNETSADNGVGFSSADARAGTLAAKSYAKNRRLVDWQVEQWTRPTGKAGYPRLAKYHGQLDPDSLMERLGEVKVEAKASDSGSLSEARREYARIRRLFVEGSDADSGEFDAAVKARVGEGATPEQFIAAAQAMRVRCRRCAGTGQYVKPTGPGGICFRCKGKGEQNEADARRNWGYDHRYAVTRAQ
jgi:hypothetical protein